MRNSLCRRLEKFEVSAVSKAFRIKHGVFFLIGFLPVVLTSCAINPVTGKRELSMLSRNEEIQLGSQADRQITSALGQYVENAELLKYVDELGQRMAIISHRPGLKFTFRVLDSPVVNAFALPGGYVYVTRGLLAYVNSEAELAGIMGHEIGHVTAKHGVAQYSRAQLAQVGFNLGYAFSPVVRQFGDVLQMGVGMLFLKFSREQESQADSLGVEYSSRIGYDATRVSRFFDTIRRLQDESGQDLPTWLSTHPNPVDREAATLRMAKRWQHMLPPYDFEVDQDRYLDCVDGIVFGKEPRQGFVENGYFYHPILDFQFPVPPGWRLTNTPEQVQLVNRNQSAAIQVSLAEEKRARDAIKEFTSDPQVRVIRSSSKEVNGYQTEVVEADVTNDSGTFRVLSYFLEKDGRVFILRGISRPNRYARHVQVFRNSLDQFDRLRNERAKNIKPTRVKVVSVKQKQTLETFLVDYPNSKLSRQQMAILNGMALSDTLQPGQRIKVLVN